MFLVEIVSHCYARELPHYADALYCQLASLADCKPTHCVVSAAICYLNADQAVANVLAHFEDSLDIRRIELETVGQIGRRSIGRNRAAKSTKADLVWFADVDMLFGPRCIDQLVIGYLDWPDDVSLCYPRGIQICKTHELGDILLANHCTVATINPADFKFKTYNRAIGGVQIITGDTARRYGYLDKHWAYQQPAAKPFADFHDDIAFRKECQQRGRIWPIELPDLYRLRHTRKTHG